MDAEDCWVSTSGSPVGDGSISTPYDTIETALENINNSTSTCDIINVIEGSYTARPDTVSISGIQVHIIAVNGTGTVDIDLDGTCSWISAESSVMNITGITIFSGPEHLPTGATDPVFHFDKVAGSSSFIDLTMSGCDAGGMDFFGEDPARRTSIPNSIPMDPIVVTYTNCQFDGLNMPTNGGVISIALPNNVATLVVQDCEFTDNYVHTSIIAKGGAIYSEVDTLIEDTLFQNNTAVFQGGAIWIAGIAIINRCNFIENKQVAIVGTPINAGGAGVHLSNVADVVGCIFTYNQADSGGAGICFDANDNDPYINGAIDNYRSVNDSIFLHNVALGGGGGAIAHTGDSNTRTLDVCISNCTIHDNTASFGGGMWINIARDLSILNTDISGNLAVDSLAGAFCTEGMWGTGYIFDSVINDNYAHSIGGAIHAEIEGMYVYNTEIKNNTADGGSGGAMAYFEANTPPLAYSVIFDNCQIVDNTAIHGSNARGGGLWTEGTSKPILLKDTLIDSNRAGMPPDFIDTNGFGGGVYTRGLEVEIDNCTFIGNHASVSGGCIYHRLGGNDETINISNSMFDGNFVNGEGSDSSGCVFMQSFDFRTGTAMNITGSTFINNYVEETSSAGAVGVTDVLYIDLYFSDNVFCNNTVNFTSTEPIIMHGDPESIVDPDCIDCIIGDFLNFQGVCGGEGFTNVSALMMGDNPMGVGDKKHVCYNQEVGFPCLIEDERPAQWIFLDNLIPDNITQLFAIDIESLVVEMDNHDPDDVCEILITIDTLVIACEFEVVENITVCYDIELTDKVRDGPHNYCPEDYIHEPRIWLDCIDFDQDYLDEDFLSIQQEIILQLEVDVCGVCSGLGKPCDTKDDDENLLPWILFGVFGGLLVIIVKCWCCVALYSECKKRRRKRGKKYKNINHEMKNLRQGVTKYNISNKLDYLLANKDY